MIELLVIICCAIILILLKIIFGIKFKSIINLKDRCSKELEDLSNKFPKDEKICKDILKELNNENVNIKIEPEYTSCLYTVFNNTITIGRFKQNYMKLQTIAHECIHSTQSNRILWANFIVSNIFLIYYLVILILDIFNKLPYPNIHIIILIFLSLIQYILRSNLENDAMLKAKYVAKEYIEKYKILEEHEEEKLLIEYEEINKMGIPFINFNLIFNNFFKIIIFSIIVLI